MSTANQIVTDAYRLLGLIDINDPSPSPAETTEGLRTLDKLIDSWAREGLNVAEQVLSSAFETDGTTVTVDSTAKLAPFLNVAGTGIAADTRIKTIDSPITLTLDTAAILGGTVDLTFSLVPMHPSFERGVAALLALDIAPMAGKTPHERVVRMADDGWGALCGNFFVVPEASFDPALTHTSAQRVAGTMDGV